MAALHSLVSSTLKILTFLIIKPNCFSLLSWCYLSPLHSRLPCIISFFSFCNRFQIFSPKVTSHCPISSLFSESQINLGKSSKTDVYINLTRCRLIRLHNATSVLLFTGSFFHMYVSFGSIAV